MIRNIPAVTSDEATGSPSIQDVTLVPSGTTWPSMVAVPRKMFGGTSPGGVEAGSAAGQFAATEIGVGDGAGTVVATAGDGVATGVEAAARVGVAAGVGVAVGVGVNVADGKVAAIGTRVSTGSSEPPHPRTANIARTIPRLTSNLTVERILV